MALAKSDMPSECECCPTTVTELQSRTPKAKLVYKWGMWICPDCHTKETEAQAANSTADAQNRRVAEMNATMQRNRAQQTDIKLVEDIHNAKTMAIVELEAAIMADDSIPADKKVITLAQELHARYTHNAQLIFDARQLVVDKGNEQRALDSYMSRISSQLREAEREKYKLKDANYTPDSVKPGKSRIRLPKPGKPTPSTGRPRQTKKKLDIDAIKVMCKKHNLDASKYLPAVSQLLNIMDISIEAAVIRISDSVNKKK